MFFDWHRRRQVRRVIAKAFFDVDRRDADGFGDLDDQIFSFFRIARQVGWRDRQREIWNVAHEQRAVAVVNDAALGWNRGDSQTVAFGLSTIGSAFDEVEIAGAHEERAEHHEKDDEARREFARRKRRADIAVMTERLLVQGFADGTSSGFVDRGDALIDAPERDAFDVRKKRAGHARGMLCGNAAE